MGDNERKNIIFLDACLDDIEASKNDVRLEEIYNNQRLFGFFAFHDEHFPYSYRYIDKAEYCRNHGYSLAQMLDELQYLHNEITVMRETAAALLEELKQYDEEETAPEPVQLVPTELEPQEPPQEVQSQHEIIEQNKKRDRKIMIAIAVIFLCFIISGYVYSYNEIERSIHNQKYLAAVAEWNAEKAAIRNNATEAKIKITTEDTLIRNNSVGDDWGIEHYVNGVLIDEFDTILVKFGSKMKVETYIVEYDSVRDSSINRVRVNAKKDSLITGCYITQTTYVRENRGRYTGNTAEWETRYDFIALFDYPPKPEWDDITVSRKEVHDQLFLGFKMSSHLKM